MTSNHDLTNDQVASAERITVNGQEYHPGAGENILDLVEKHVGKELNADGTAADGGKLGIAVAVDGSVVRRTQWQHTRVTGAIDIVTAVQGG